MGRNRKRFYAVRVGRVPGIYQEWYGPKGAHEQVDRFKDAEYKGFAWKEDAEEFMKQKPKPKKKKRNTKRKRFSGNPNRPKSYEDALWDEADKKHEAMRDKK